MEKQITIPAKTAAALLMACVNVNDIIENGAVNSEVLDELKYLQPFLDDFAAMA